jgi:hypothetical protein
MSHRPLSVTSMNSSKPGPILASLVDMVKLGVIELTSPLQSRS